MMPNPDRPLKALLFAVLGFGCALAGVPLLWRGWAALYALMHRGYRLETWEER